MKKDSSKLHTLMHCISRQSLVNTHMHAISYFLLYKVSDIFTHPKWYINNDFFINQQHHVLKKMQCTKEDESLNVVKKTGMECQFSKYNKKKQHVLRQEKFDFKTVFTLATNIIFFKIIELLLPSYIFKDIHLTSKKQNCIHQ